jgi:3-phosphoshikimate 1-carboxyvinyltransferase
MHSENGTGRTWDSPAAIGAVSARVRLPASKSITNRALILAALSANPAVIVNPLQARDTMLAAAALRALGSEITADGEPDQDGRTVWHLVPGQPASGREVSVDVGNAGTVMRFMPGVAALTPVTVRFDGDERARERPVGPILTALRQLGADIDDGGRGALPFTVLGHGAIRGGSVTLDASGSSQLVSGLLLTAPRFTGGVEIRHEGPPVPSAPHIAMTVRMLRAAGAEVTETSSAADGRPDAWRVRPGPIDLGTVTVEPDLSNAGPFLAAALVTGGTITIADWPQDSLQAAGQIVAVLTQMGARFEPGEAGMKVTGSGRVHGITADLRDVPELGQVLAAAATVADSPSVFTGLGHTRTQETDRLAAVAKEINALGGDITELPDGLQIRPRPLRAGAGEVFGTYHDHRMVMAAAVLGLVTPGLRVANVDTVAKTFPAFTEVWTQMLGSGR